MNAEINKHGQLLTLISEAQSLGIKVNYRWDNDTITAKIEAANSGIEEDTSLLDPENKADTSKVKAGKEPAKPMTLEEYKATLNPEVQKVENAEIKERNSLHKSANKLVHCIVVPRDPTKIDHYGAITTAYNNIIGTVKKFIGFNTPTHVPQILFNVLNEKEYQHIYEVKVDGKTVKRVKQVPMYSITVLDNLTQKEIDKLAAENKRK